MTDKKHHKHENEQVRAQGTPPAPDEMDESRLASVDHTARSDIDDAQFEALKKKLAEAESKVQENLDGWQRAVAEFQNYKKRMERDRETDKSMMKGDLIKRFLPVLDDLERALSNRQAESGTDEAWSGIELIVRKLQSILEAEGMQRIAAEGAAFDPNFHEAISYEPMDGTESGHVIAVVQNGYLLGDRVVRPAMVRVAK